MGTQQTEVRSNGSGADRPRTDETFRHLIGGHLHPRVLLFILTGLGFQCAVLSCSQPLAHPSGERPQPKRSGPGQSARRALEHWVSRTTPDSPAPSPYGGIFRTYRSFGGDRERPRSPPRGSANLRSGNRRRRSNHNPADPRRRSEHVSAADPWPASSSSRWCTRITSGSPGLSSGRTPAYIRDRSGLAIALGGRIWL